MLPARSRLTAAEQFAAAIRRGRRSGRSRLVVHLQIEGGEDVPRAGLVVSKAVGGSVVRHRVARRLRHLLAPRLAALPTGSRVVVRALPRSASASSVELGADLDSALRTVLRTGPASGRGARPPAAPRVDEEQP